MTQLARAAKITSTRRKGEEARMRDLVGKTAFVTGGASGFGLEFAKLFLAEGMKVFLVDIEASALSSALSSLGGPNDRLRGAVCDCANRVSLEHAATEAFDAFGAVHLVCNNAGVGGGSGGLDEFSVRHWDWVMSVNLMGVVHGIAVFLPHMRAHGEGGHILNTASMAGMLGQPFGAPYSASKAAVIAISETLSYELRETNIGVSVLCPGFAKTRIAASERNQPADLKEAPRAASQAAADRAAQSILAVATGIEPAEVAARALEGIKEDDLYIFTHPGMRRLIDKRFSRIQAAYDKADSYFERAATPSGPR
jgi:NAD(P)-dependent dehydrogenase (short-subunit alcohol dehydrogenase family)